jgi:hypothetical protein
MKYMVMECHPGYAVVMDNAGRFLKVANMHYEVGQTVTSVLKMKNADALNNAKTIHLRKMWVSIASIAACLCLVALGGWRFLMSPYGSVRMQINPDVQMIVNRLDYVIGLDGLNNDGDDLIENYSYQWKKVDQVSDELADRAVEMGYLKENGTIRITVESEHEKWKTGTEERIIIELKNHMKDSIIITSDSSDDSFDTTPQKENIITIPIHPTQPSSDDEHGNYSDDNNDIDDGAQGDDNNSDDTDDDNIDDSSSDDDIDDGGTDSEDDNTGDVDDTDSDDDDSGQDDEPDGDEFDPEEIEADDDSADDELE